MKKLTKIFAALTAACALVLCFAFAGCGSKVLVVKTDSGDVESVVITATNDVIELSDDTSFYDYMVALKEQGKLQFEGYESTYGFYITSVEGVAEVNEGTSGKSWMVYTDLVSIEGDDAVYSLSDYGTYEYDGVTYNSATVGVEGLPCVEGYTYVLVYSEWSW